MIILVNTATLNSTKTLDLRRKLANKPGEEIAATFAAITYTVTNLDLSNNELGSRAVGHLATDFAALPLSITTLNLAENNLGNRTGAELAIAFAKLPRSITNLDLAENDLGNKTGAELAIAFAKLPRSITSLNLADNKLWKITGAELATALAALPPSITSLNLADGLSTKNAAELVTVFAKLPHSITSLDLAENNLGNRTGTELATAFAALPHSITNINLRDNGLLRRNAAELDTIFAALPSSITSFNLNGTRTWRRNRDKSGRTGAGLAKILAALPHSITSINLRGYELSEYSGAELVTAFAALPPSITNLDLHGNRLGYKTEELGIAFTELATAFAALPHSILSLDLCGNYLECHTGVELATIFAALPPSITSLNLAHNDLSKYTGAELATAFAALPGSITTINLKYNNLNDKTDSELKEIFKPLINSTTPKHIIVEPEIQARLNKLFPAVTISPTVSIVFPTPMISEPSLFERLSILTYSMYDTSYKLEAFDHLSVQMLIANENANLNLLTKCLLEEITTRANADKLLPENKKMPKPSRVLFVNPKIYPALYADNPNLYQKHIAELELYPELNFFYDVLIKVLASGQQLTGLYEQIVANDQLAPLNFLLHELATLQPKYLNELISKLRKHQHVKGLELIDTLTFHLYAMSSDTVKQDTEFRKLLTSNIEWLRGKSDKHEDDDIDVFIKTLESDKIKPTKPRNKLYLFARVSARVALVSLSTISSGYPNQCIKLNMHAL